MTKPIKRMVYTNEHRCDLLYSDVYKGYLYFIMDYGMYPCCYIVLDKDNKYYSQDYNNIPLNVHGGLTFSSSELHGIMNKDDNWIIGWDYAHYTDRVGEYYISGHTWKTTELIRECIKAIDELEVLCNG